MNVKIVHPELGPQITRLSASSAIGATSSTVDNNSGFANGDYVVFGVLGEEKTELIILTAPSGTVTIGHTSGLIFDHDARTPVSEIPYNQAEVYRATSQAGTYSLIATTSFTVDESYTIYNDADGTSSSWYKVRYKNSNSTTYSEYSDTVQGTGYTEDALRSMTDEVLEDYGDLETKEVSRRAIKRYLNAGARILTRKLIEVCPDYRRNYTTQALTSGTSAYNLPTRFISFIRVDVNFDSSTATDANKVERFDSESEGQPDTEWSELDPRIAFRGNQFVIRPTPDNSSGYAFLWYWDYPATMVDEADEHGLPYGAREPLVAYTLFRLWLAKNQDKAGMYKTEFKESTKEFIEFVASNRQKYSNRRVQVIFGGELYEE